MRRPNKKDRPPGDGDGGRQPSDEAQEDVDPALQRLIDAVNDVCDLARFNPYTGAAETGLRLFGADLAARFGEDEAIRSAVPTEVVHGGRPIPGFLVLTDDRVVLVCQDPASPAQNLVEDLPRGCVTSVTHKHHRLGVLAGYRALVTVAADPPDGAHRLLSLRVVDGRHGKVGRLVADSLSAGAGRSPDGG